MQGVFAYKHTFGGSKMAGAFSGGYTYGFNGQAKDDEVYGEGNSYTAEFWQYDPRLGRRWNVDPVDQISISNYACFENNPINNVDINGAFATKAGAWLYRLFHGKKDDIIYKSESGKNKGQWIVGRDEFSFLKVTNEVNTYQFTFIKTEIIHWGQNRERNNAKGTMWIYDSRGSGTDADAYTHGNPEFQMDFADLDIFNSPLKNKAMKYLKSFVNRRGTKDMKDVAEAIDIMHKSLKVGEKSVKWTKKAYEFLKSNDDDGRIPTTTFPNSIDKNITSDGFIIYDQKTGIPLDTFLTDPDKINMPNGKNIMEYEGNNMKYEKIMKNEK